MNAIANYIPEVLNLHCSRHFTYQDLIECGDTWHRLRAGNVALDNTPKCPATFRALEGLACNILDPIVGHFGHVKLTYGFCSHVLEKAIKRRISPAHDQHASEECRPNGKRICDRGGASCDFLVEGYDMREVAYWVMRNLPFDRLYLYEPDRPLHVSWAARPTGATYEMRLSPTGRRPPRPLKLPE